MIIKTKYGKIYTNKYFERGAKGLIMKKVDKTVIKETIYITLWTLILSGILESVFIFIGWDYTVLLGNILGGGVAILNFFLLGLTVQKAVNMEDSKNAKNFMKLSQSLRFIMLILAAVLGAVVPCFNIWSTIIPLLFPRIALLFRPVIKRRETDETSENNQIQNS